MTPSCTDLRSILLKFECFVSMHEFTYMCIICANEGPACWFPLDTCKGHRYVSGDLLYHSSSIPVCVVCEWHTYVPKHACHVPLEWVVGRGQLLRVILAFCFIKAGTSCFCRWCVLQVPWPMNLSMFLLILLLMLSEISDLGYYLFWDCSSNALQTETASLPNICSVRHNLPLNLELAWLSCKEAST